MSRASQSRRAVAVLKSGAGQPTPPKIGNRSPHQYWALLKTHFRSVLLPPQSLAEGASTQWTWNEPAAGPPLTAADLATVRKRLAGAQRSLVDSVEDAPEPSADARHAGSVLPQLQTHMDAIVTALIALPDGGLAAYAVRTEQGLLLHSWGLATALTPHYPDNTESEISGTVFVGDAPAPDREVSLENFDGSGRPARTRSDAAGRFRFSKISPGRYRAHVVSERETFPPEGVTVDIERTSVTGLELRDKADRRSAAPLTGQRARRHRGRSEVAA